MACSPELSPEAIPATIRLGKGSKMKRAPRGISPKGARRRGQAEGGWRRRTAAVCFGCRRGGASASGKSIPRLPNKSLTSCAHGEEVRREEIERDEGNRRPRRASPELKRMSAAAGLLGARARGNSWEGKGEYGEALSGLYSNPERSKRRGDHHGRSECRRL